LASVPSNPPEIKEHFADAMPGLLRILHLLRLIQQRLEERKNSSVTSFMGVTTMKMKFVSQRATTGERKRLPGLMEVRNYCF